MSETEIIANLMNLIEESITNDEPARIQAWSLGDTTYQEAARYLEDRGYGFIDQEWKQESP